MYYLLICVKTKSRKEESEPKEPGYLQGWWEQRVRVGGTSPWICPSHSSGCRTKWMFPISQSVNRDWGRTLMRYRQKQMNLTVLQIYNIITWKGVDKKRPRNFGNHWFDYILLVWARITRWHQMGLLEQQALISRSSGWRLEVWDEVAGRSVLGEGPLLAYRQPSSCVFTWRASLFC